MTVIRYDRNDFRVFFRSNCNFLPHGIRETWTGGTITAVFSPERVTKIVKREIEAKTGIPTDHQQLVVGVRVLTDNASMKEYGLSEGRTIEMTAKLLGGMKHKLSALNQWILKEKQRGKNQNRASTWETWKTKILK